MAMAMAGAAGRPQTPGEDDAYRLRSMLEAGPSSPGDIFTACHAVETVSRQLPRPFFRLCFPLLLRRLFGFEDLQAVASAPITSSGGWLSVVSQPGNEAAAGVLITLLAPGGTLFRSLLAADKENVVRYVFPLERLPDWVRRLLAVERGAMLLEQVSILFKNRLKEDVVSSVQVELDVFQYYIFWFAYYAVCKEDSAPGLAKKTKPGISRSSQLRTQIENWASSIPGLHYSSQQGPLISPLHPYLQLLQLYLSHFVGPSMFRKDMPSFSLWQEDNASHADILVRTLIDFWLIDDDPCPFPFSFCQSLQLRMLAPVSLYVPPGTDLSDAVRLLINYFSALLQIHLGNHAQLFTTPESGIGYRRKAALKSEIRSSPPSAVPTVSVSPYLQCLQRPLYRFCLRAFCFWPVGTPVTKMLPIVDVWLHYLEPWGAILLVPNESNVQPGSRVAIDETTRVYSGYWQGYVLSNYPFYVTLLSHFLDFALKFLHVDMELIFQATCKILNVLSRSRDLLDLLRRVEAAYSDHFLGRHHYMGNPFADRIPTIQEQIQDWEEGLPNVEQEHGEMLRSSIQNRGPNLHFFSGAGKGGHHTLQAMILQAEAEIQACCTEKLPMSPKTLEAAKELVRKIFDQDVSDKPSPLNTESGTPLQTFAQMGNPVEISKPSGLQRHTWAEVKYRGDWMRRPIESHEIAWLVRLLVRVSESLNDSLGLLPGSEEATNGCNLAEARPRRDAIEICLPEVLRPVLNILQVICNFIRKELRKLGFRVNLRPLADKQVIAFVLLVMLLYWMSTKVARLTQALISL